MANERNTHKSEMERGRKQLFLELKLSERTRRRHEAHWRDLMLQITIPQLKECVASHQQSFERILDSKDFEISYLMDDLQQQEEQYAKNEQSHIQKIDALIVLCHDQIEELYRTSKLIRYKIFRDVTFEWNDLIAGAKEREDFLKLMQYMLKTQHQVCGAQIRGECTSTLQVEISKQDDMLQQFQAEMENSKQQQIANAIQFVEKYNEEFDRMRSVYVTSETDVSKAKTIMRELQRWEDKQQMHVASTLQFLNKYTEKFDLRKNAYNKLLALEDASRSLIARQWQRIKHKYEIIAKLKHKLKLLHNIQGPQQIELKLECKYFEKVFRMQQTQCKKEAENDEAILSYLITESSDALKVLEQLYKVGQQLLTYVSICRKYETEKEKIGAFPTFGVEDATFNEKKNRELEILGAQERKAHDVAELSNFWLRVGKAETSRYILQENVNLMHRENKRLKQKMFQYCHCVKCPKFK